MNTYDKTISFWNNIFNKNVPKEYIKSIKINESLENAIYWLSDNSRSILDYGCGFRVIIMTQANSQVNTRVLELLPKFKIKKMNRWCAV